MQAVGALIANVVAVSAVASFRNSLPQGSTSTSCDVECKEVVDTMWRWIVGLGAVPPVFAILLRWWIPESPRYTLEVEKDPHKAKEDINAYYQPDPGLLPTESPGFAGPSNRADSTFSESLSPSTEATLTFGEPIEMKDLTLTEAAMAPPPSAQRTVQKETWKEFYTGFYAYMITEGNWTDLAGTSISWMTLDFAFYFLGVNSPKLLSKIWNSSPNESLYPMLLENGYRALIAVSIGAILGGILFIIMARYRFYLQVNGFWILAALFIAVGVCFVVLLGTRYFAAVIVMYSVCSLFFNFGPNTSTFVISAEVFPTKYRCTCAGISAASGKLGSIIAQVFLAYAKFGSPGVSVNDPHSTWLGWVLLVFALWMVFGAVITKVWVPNPCNLWNQSRSLEELGLGKASRKRMEKEERDAWRAFVPGSPHVM